MQKFWSDRIGGAGVNSQRKNYHWPGFPAPESRTAECKELFRLLASTIFCFFVSASDESFAGNVCTVQPNRETVAHDANRFTQFHILRVRLLPAEDEIDGPATALVIQPVPTVIQQGQVVTSRPFQFISEDGHQIEPASAVDFARQIHCRPGEDHRRSVRRDTDIVREPWRRIRPDSEWIPHEFAHQVAELLGTSR